MAAAWLQNLISGYISNLDKLDKVTEDVEKTESMVNQVLHRTFTKQQGCDRAILLTGPKVLYILTEHSYTLYLQLTTTGQCSYYSVSGSSFPLIAVSKFKYINE